MHGFVAVENISSTACAAQNDAAQKWMDGRSELRKEKRMDSLLWSTFNLQNALHGIDKIPMLEMTKFKCCTT